MGVCACCGHGDRTEDGWGRGWMWGAERKGRMEGNDKVREVTAAKVQSGLFVTICLHPCLCGLSLPLMHVLIGPLLPFWTFSKLFLFSPSTTFHSCFTHSHYMLPACLCLDLFHSWHVERLLQCFRYIHPRIIHIRSSSDSLSLNLSLNSWGKGSCIS